MAALDTKDTLREIL